jgi:hypothetical protein
LKPALKILTHKKLIKVTFQTKAATRFQVGEAQRVLGSAATEPVP